MVDDSAFSKSFKTKLRIYEALGTCLESTPIDKVTVSMICQTAKVGKSTFYLYFQDKYTIAQWYLDMLYEAGVTQIGRTMGWRRGHFITTTGIFQQKSIIMAAAQSDDYNAINRYSERKREADLVETITAYQGMEMTPRLRAQVLAVSVGERAVIARLLSETPDVSIEEAVDCLLGIVPAELHDALAHPKREESSGVANALLSLKQRRVLGQH